MQPRRVTAYLRVSGAEQGRSGTSLEGQREEIERYCKAHGLPAPRFVVEVGSAGAEKLDGRPKLRALLDEVEAGDLVVVAKQDRWSRNTLFYLQSTREIVSRGARFFSLAERFDPSTPEGAFAATIMAAVAEQERQRIIDRTVGRRRELRAQGCWVEGPPPFGYRVEKRKLVVYEEEARVVREAFARCIAGESTVEIATWLRSIGRTRLAYKKSTNLLLRARWYLGELRTVAGIWLAAHEPIVNVETFERAQAAMTSRRRGGAKPRTDSKSAGWLGRGLLVCARCGARMGPAYGPKSAHGYYLCGSRARLRSCDQPYAVVANVDAQLVELTRARLLELRHDLGRGEEQAARPSRATELRAQAERLAAKRERTIDLITDGTVDVVNGRERLAKIDAELARLREETRAEERRTLGARVEVRREVLADVEQLERAWSLAPVAVKREIVRTLAERLEVEAGEVRVSWRSVGELAASRDLSRG
jgi:site-specific DNA recombinase